MSKEKQPWDKLPGETERAYDTFLAFVRLPPHRRRYKDLREATQPDEKKRKHIPGHWSKWRSTWKWDERARARDQHILDEERKELLAVQKERLANRRTQADILLSACENLFQKEAVLEDMFERAPASVVSLYKIASDIREKTDKEMLGVNTLQVQETPRTPTEEEEAEILSLVALLKGQAKEGNTLASRLLFKLNGVDL